MGRGRQKAKAQRQARDIKYYSPATDLTALERELGVRNERHTQARESDASYDDDYSEYDDLAKKYADDSEDDGRR